MWRFFKAILRDADAPESTLPNLHLWLWSEIPPKARQTVVLLPGMSLSVLQRPEGGAGENLPALWEGDMNVKKRCTKCGESKPVDYVL